MGARVLISDGWYKFNMSSISKIASKHVTEITVEDFQTLIDLEAEETAILELKADLSAPNGGKSWRKGEKSVQPTERDALAKEIVAFANTRGGRVFVGISESSDNPRRAKQLALPLPRIFDLAVSFQEVVHSERI